MQATDNIQAPCGHSFFKIVKHGHRYNKIDKVQKYSCIQCGHKFSFGPQKKKKLTYEVWKFITHCHLNKMSSRAIKKAVLLEFKLDISHNTILDWLEITPEFFKKNPLEQQLIEYQKKKLFLQIHNEQKLLSRYETKKMQILKNIPRLENKIKELNHKISQFKQEMSEIK